MLYITVEQIRTKVKGLLNRADLYFNDTWRYEPLRIQCDKLLNDFARFYNYPFFGTVLVDAGWDNPNYWLRYSVLRAALGLTSTKEIGFLGPFRKKQQRGTLRRLGINEVFDFVSRQEFSKSNYELASSLCRSLNSAEDVLQWELPYGLPADFLYDYILKRQRQATIKIGDSKIVDYVHFFLDCISSAENIINQYKPDLIISSHALSWYAPLIWLSTMQGIKVVIPFGDNGVCRFRQINHPLGIHNLFIDSPMYNEYLKFSYEKKCFLKDIGKKYLDIRLKGKTGDLGSIFAYRKRKKNINRSTLCFEFGWQQSKSIICIYAGNWFDYPHSLGMSSFCDFNDWIVSTFNIAKQNKNVNWLFKAHPCDEWYRGITLKDIIKGVDKYDHIKLVPSDWNSAELLKSIDAVVTYHGTIGLEATILGRPVLVADKGWYHDWGFVKLPESRKDYFKLLNSYWWEDMAIEKNSELAQIFAGWYWGRPAWQKDFLLEDDAHQWENYKTFPNLLQKNKDEIDKEIQIIRDWIQSDYVHYHIYKMLQADEYII